MRFSVWEVVNDPCLSLVCRHCLSQLHCVRLGQVRSECLTCTFRVGHAFHGRVQGGGYKKGGGSKGGDAYTGGYKGVGAVRPESVAGGGWPLCIRYISLMYPLSYFSFQPVLHEWCNKGRGMCYPVCGMVHIKEPLLLIGKSSPCGGSGFPFSLSEWSLTICPTPYNHKQNVLSASLNKTFPSFLSNVVV